MVDNSEAGESAGCSSAVAGSPELGPANNPLKVVVRNTFLDVVDAQNPHSELRKSRSESEISSSSSSLSSAEQMSLERSFQPRLASTSKETPSSHLFYDESLSSSSMPSVSVLPTEPLPSIGSASHFNGDCQPCSFFRKSRCMLQQKCLHCHYQHDVQTRPGKKAREREKVRLAKAMVAGEVPSPKQTPVASTAGRVTGAGSSVMRNGYPTAPGQSEAGQKSSTKIQL